MQTHYALGSILYVFAAALASATLLAKLKQPTLVGFILGGMLIGPHGLQLVPYQNVEFLAEMGIGLLMFAIGAELSIAQLMRVKGIAIGGGLGTLLVTTVICVAIGPLFRWSMPEAFVWGTVIGLSSTVVVLKLLSERGEVGSTYGNISTGILLFQDVAAVPLLVLLPILAIGSSANLGAASLTEIGWILGKLVAFVASIFILGKYVIPKFLKFVASTHSKELFSISILALTIAIAALSHEAGLSLALGAFLAGLLLSESDFGNQAVSELLPLKDSFSAVFFVSVGMLLDFSYFIEKWPVFTIGLALIIVAKFFIVLFFCFLFRYPSKISVFVALALAQIGEFGFLVLMASKKLSIISDHSYQRLLGISILSIVATPYILKLYPYVKKGFAFMNRFSWIGRDSSESTSHLSEENMSEWKDHIVLCGYGPIGSFVAKKLQSIGLRVVIVDLNYKMVQELKAHKQHAVYGDSSSMIVLEAAGISQAALLVVTIPDPRAMQSLLKKIKKRMPHLQVVVRARYMADRDKMAELGADEVVWEEYEAGQEIINRSLSRLNIDPV